VLAGGGLVDPAVDTIEVSTRPGDIPDELVVDISSMAMDSVIRLSDIAFPAGVTPLGDPDMPVVTVLFMRASELETDAVTAEAAEGEAAAGDQAEAAEGEGGDAEAGGGEAAAGDGAE
jgi:large subunit ribosomal protein L25